MKSGSSAEFRELLIRETFLTATKKKNTRVARARNFFVRQTGQKEWKYDQRMGFAGWSKGQKKKQKKIVEVGESSLLDTRLVFRILAHGFGPKNLSTFHPFLFVFPSSKFAVLKVFNFAPLKSFFFSPPLG